MILAWIALLVFSYKGAEILLKKTADYSSRAISFPTYLTISVFNRSEK